MASEREIGDGRRWVRSADEERDSALVCRIRSTDRI
jgi:hypothetical protein